MNRQKKQQGVRRVVFQKSSYSEETGIFKGYASVFDVVDSQDEVVVKGAFSKFLKGDISRVKILALHNDEWLPIGKPLLMREDDVGLYIEAKISKTDAGKDILTLMRDGVLDEMSIGFLVSDYYDEDGIRYLTEIELQEISIVTWAANPAAKILEVKSALKKSTSTRIELEDLMELADSLEEIVLLIRGNCSTGEAKGKTKSNSKMEKSPDVVHSKSFKVPRRIKSHH